MRKEHGGTMAEFGATFFILILFFFIPLINLGSIATRYFLTAGIVNEFVHRLALAEKRSQSYDMLADDTGWSDFARKCGVSITNKKLALVVCGDNASEKIQLNSGEPLASQWLPGGSKAPCLYTMELVATAQIPPVFPAGPSVPGITTPIAMNFVGRSAWENLSRDPDTKEYYVNE